MSLPLHRLIRHIVRDNAIFFVGSQLQVNPDERPLLEQIAVRLAEEMDYTGPMELSAVAQAYEVQYKRQQLIQTIKEILRELQQPADAYQLLANTLTPFAKIITTRFDQTIENSLRSFDKEYVSIIDDKDVASFDESLITLIKMRGDIGREDSLIITRDDLRRFLRNLPVVSDVIRAFFATKTLIFLGYQLDDPVFLDFFQEVADQLTVYRRQSYAFVTQPLADHMMTYWAEKSVQVIVEPDILGFLQRLATAVQETQSSNDGQTPSPAEPLDATLPLPHSPYKALASFTLQDRAIFHGRQTEITQLTRQILGHPLLVVYGESGSGKTSLLQAGVIPNLAHEDVLLATAQPETERPLSVAWQEGLYQTAQSASLSLPPDLNLAELVTCIQASLERPVVLLLDQAEQLFVAYNEEERETAVATLQQLYQQQQTGTLDLRLVFVIREDFVGKLQLLDTALPGLLDNRFRLEILTRENAKEAIVKPATSFGIEWEPKLTAYLLDQLQQDGSIAPPQLQIVCTHLYETAVAQQSTTITWDQFTNIQVEVPGEPPITGIEAILWQYLDGVVADLPAAQTTIAKRLLGALVNSQRIKQRLRLSDLVRAAETDATTAVPILTLFIDKRLLHRYDTPDQPAYELVHDSLVVRIVAWLGPDFWDGQRAREILRHAAPEWITRQRLLSVSDFHLIERQQGQLDFVSAENEVLYATAVAHDLDSTEWASRLPDATRRSVLQHLTQSDDPSIRQHSLLAMGPLADEVLIPQIVHAAIHDVDPAVRKVAAITLADNELWTAVELLVTAVVEVETAVAAEQALVIWLDRATAVQAHLPTPLHRTIQQRVWRIRWQRYRHTIIAGTVRGAVGGFIGLGLGTGLSFAFGSGSWTQFTPDAWPRVIYSLAFSGMTHGSFIGVMAFAPRAFLENLWVYVGNGRQRQTTIWLLGTLLVALSMGIGLMSMSAWGLGALNWWNFVTGFLLGGTIAAIASFPAYKNRWLRIGLTFFVSTTVHFAIAQLNQSLFISSPWLLLAGIMNGLGFLYAFNRLEIEL